MGFYIFKMLISGIGAAEDSLPNRNSQRHYSYLRYNNSMSAGEMWLLIYPVKGNSMCSFPADPHSRAEGRQG